MSRFQLRSLGAIAVTAAFLLGAPATAEAAAGTTVHLSASAEVPPNASTATGHFTYQLKGARLCYTLEANGLTAGVTGAHVHDAAAGVVGPVVIPLTVDAGATSFLTEECVPVDKALVKAIRSTPSEYYVNVHTQTFPAGEVRAQLG